MRTHSQQLLTTMRKRISISSALIGCSFLAFLALTPARAMAQAGAIQQVDSAQQRRQLDQSAAATSEVAPELYPDEASDVGPQYVVVYKPRKTYFDAMADVQYFYTDNVFLGDSSGKTSADVMVGTVQLALAPTPYELAGGELAPRVGYRHQWYLFGLLSEKRQDVFNFETFTTEANASLDVFDFNAQTVFTDAQWSHGHWTAGAGFDFTRLMDSSSYNQFYREYVPRWGLRWLYPLTASATASIAYEGNYRITDTKVVFGPGADDSNDRTDHSITATYTQNLCPHALIQPYYRFRYTRFTDFVATPATESRNDYLNSVGLAFYCFFTDYINLRAFVSYDVLNSSDQSVPDYKRFDAGGGVNLNIRF
jgi:hypothetical protein